MRFSKYQALGNDYIVIEPVETGGKIRPEQVRHLCDRHYGVGADGILFGTIPDNQADFSLRIYNSDGSQAEKSGNGVRIYARYLWDRGYIGKQPFTIQTLGGKVSCSIGLNHNIVIVEMGQVNFCSNEIPVAGPVREVINENLEIYGGNFKYSALTIGNPHCVIYNREISPELTRQYGALIENQAIFPRRINVQFMKILSLHVIQIEIWERGSGYTLSSGSSSCAAAAVAYRLGFCKPPVQVHMPGGVLAVDITPDYYVTLSGPVEKVYEGNI